MTAAVPGHDDHTSDTRCDDMGPRIGEEAPRCERPKGHPGDHMPHESWDDQIKGWHNLRPGAYDSSSPVGGHGPHDDPPTEVRVSYPSAQDWDDVRAVVDGPVPETVRIISHDDDPPHWTVDEGRLRCNGKPVYAVHVRGPGGWVQSVTPEQEAALVRDVQTARTRQADTDTLGRARELAAELRGPYEAGDPWMLKVVALLDLLTGETDG